MSSVVTRLDSDQHDAHDRGGGRSSFRVLATRPCGPALCGSSRRPLAAVDQRHDRDAGLEAAQAERELRENQNRARDRAATNRPSRSSADAPVRRAARVRDDLPDAAPENDEVQSQVRQRRRRRQADGLGEALQEHARPATARIASVTRIW